MTEQTRCEECAFVGTWHFAGPLPRSYKPSVIDLAKAVEDRFGCQVCKNEEVAEQTGARKSEGDEHITDLETAWKICKGSFFKRKTTIKERLSELLDEGKH